MNFKRIATVGTGIAALILGAEKCNGVQAVRASSPSSIDTTVSFRDEGHKKIRDLLKEIMEQPSTEEQVEACKEMQREILEMDPMEDPVGFIEQTRELSACVGDLPSSEKQRWEDQDDSRLINSETSYLKRCQPIGQEEFDLSALEACEDYDGEWVTDLSEDLWRRLGINAEPEWKAQFFISPESGTIEWPGYYFTLEDAGGSYEEHYNLATVRSRDGDYAYTMMETVTTYDDSYIDDGDNHQFSHSIADLGRTLTREYRETQTEDR